MYRNSVLRQIIIFIIGSLVNLGMFCLSKYAAFPVWADYAGSVYIAALAGPIHALASCVLHTFLMVLLIDGAYAVWYILPALVICALIYLLRRADMPLSPVNMCAVGFALSLTSFATTLAVFLLNGAHGRREWAAELIDNGFIRVMISAGIGFTEAALTAAVFYILFILTPKNDEKLIFKR